MPFHGELARGAVRGAVQVVYDRYGNPVPSGAPTRSSSTATDDNGTYFPRGREVEIVSEEEYYRAQGMRSKPRRRRKRLLTCSDKADIAFLHGQLGGGALGRAAISSLLSRRCG